jgi:hypothetical protein
VLENKVARDGIEPPTPTFSGLLADKAKWFEIRGSLCATNTFDYGKLGSFGMIWDAFGSSVFPYCSRQSTVRDDRDRCNESYQPTAGGDALAFHRDVDASISSRKHRCAGSLEPIRLSRPNENHWPPPL